MTSISNQISDELRKVEAAIQDLDRIANAAYIMGNESLGSTLYAITESLATMSEEVKTIVHDGQMVELNRVNNQLGDTLSSLLFAGKRGID